MTKMTSARAAKELRSLNDQRDALFNREKKTSAFTAALQEDIESVRPDYRYVEENKTRVKSNASVFQPPISNKLIDVAWII